MNSENSDPRPRANVLRTLVGDTFLSWWRPQWRCALAGGHRTGPPRPATEAALSVDGADEAGDVADRLDALVDALLPSTRTDGRVAGQLTGAANRLHNRTRQSMNRLDQSS